MSSSIFHTFTPDDALNAFSIKSRLPEEFGKASGACQEEEGTLRRSKHFTWWICTCGLTADDSYQVLKSLAKKQVRRAFWTSPYAAWRVCLTRTCDVIFFFKLWCLSLQMPQQVLCNQNHCDAQIHDVLWAAVSCCESRSTVMSKSPQDTFFFSTLKRRQSKVKASIPAPGFSPPSRLSLWP